MAAARKFLKEKHPNIVGSFGHADSLRNADAGALKKSCDFLEIRLDILVAEGVTPERALWSHLAGIPLLFTARRKEEGSPIDLDAAQRSELLRIAFEDAALIDIEVASIGEMAEVLTEVKQQGIPWVASYHDFTSLPSDEELTDAAKAAKAAGAHVFKAAARLAAPSDIARLADFQRAEHGLHVATMGMGPLAPVSRLLCAQCGSVLNYGFIGEIPTAPGQWSADFLGEAVGKLAPANA